MDYVMLYRFHIFLIFEMYLMIDHKIRREIRACRTRHKSFRVFRKILQMEKIYHIYGIGKNR